MEWFQQFKARQKNARVFLLRHACAAMLFQLRRGAVWLDHNRWRRGRLHREVLVNLDASQLLRISGGKARRDLVVHHVKGEESEATMPARGAGWSDRYSSKRSFDPGWECVP
jgi:hypothetical protein